MMAAAAAAADQARGVDTKIRAERQGSKSKEMVKVKPVTGRCRTVQI
jgi:hypothetical protein